MKTRYFYEKFIDESKIAEIKDYTESRKFWVNFFSLMVFSGVAGTLPTFVGYNFENVFAVCMLCWEALMLFLLVFFSYKFVSICHQYGVFKKKCLPFIFVSPFILLTLVFCIVPIFTTTFTNNPNGYFIVDLNPVFYLFIFLPVFFSFSTFCYYSFMKCFARYVKPM